MWAEWADSSSQSKERERGRQRGRILSTAELSRGTATTSVNAVETSGNGTMPERRNCKWNTFKKTEFNPQQFGFNSIKS